MIRVRFAPSPTGHLHVGGARTALYNWLFARSQGGVFVLRIEDTDTSRSTKEAVQQIISSLHWLGLDWDEGPGPSSDEGVKEKGSYGPYRQMERTKFYQQAAERLLSEGKAYRCYCTPEELEAERLRARQEGRSVVYQGRCRNLSSADEEKFQREGRKAVIRLRTPDHGKTVVRDVIRGNVEFENALLGDFILVRSNGVPTYNFAAAVDDAAMKITHVIRGDDHLPNTPRQILLFKALKETPPVYAHLPLILGRDRTPLSKRHGAVSVEEFRSKGYVREALCNYLALLGWSYDGETTLFSMSDLINKFSLERVGSTAAVFDKEKLLWMNGFYIRQMDGAELARRIGNFLESTSLAGILGKEGKPEISDLVPLVQEKMKTLADFIELTCFFFKPVEFEKAALEKLRKTSRVGEILKTAVEVLSALPRFDIENLDMALREAAAKMDIKVGKFLQPIRIAVSGKQVTPGMFETLAVLGREESVARIQSALNMLKTKEKT